MNIEENRQGKNDTSFSLFPRATKQLSVFSFFSSVFFLIYVAYACLLSSFFSLSLFIPNRLVRQLSTAVTLSAVHLSSLLVEKDLAKQFQLDNQREGCTTSSKDNITRQRARRKKSNIYRLVVNCNKTYSALRLSQSLTCFSSLSPKD